MPIPPVGSLEPDAVKVARPVLRGEGGREAPDLPDYKYHGGKGLTMSTGFDDDPPERDPTDAEHAALLVRESWWFLLALLAFLLILRTI